MRLLCLIAVFLSLSGLGYSQSREQTLADMQRELGVIRIEIASLKRELVARYEINDPLSGGFVARIEALELELARLTNTTEQLEFRIERIVRDGTNQIGDLSFRLCELESECSLDDIELNPKPLGAEQVQKESGQLGTDGLTDGLTGGLIIDDDELIVGEKRDFDLAKAAFDAGNFHQAARMFWQFLHNYPLSPLIEEAFFLQAESQAGGRNWKDAAQTYLNGFSENPDSRFAPDSLLGLGRALNELGHKFESCVMMAEVSARYPNTPAALEAQKNHVLQDCN